VLPPQNSAAEEKKPPSTSSSDCWREYRRKAGGCLPQVAAGGRRFGNGQFPQKGAVSIIIATNEQPPQGRQVHQPRWVDTPTSKAIWTILMCADDPAIVLVHGGAGLGKTHNSREYWIEIQYT
jgi:hypothetical protein